MKYKRKSRYEKSHKQAGKLLNYIKYARTRPSKRRGQVADKVNSLSALPSWKLSFATEISVLPVQKLSGISSPRNGQILVNVSPTYRELAMSQTLDKMPN